MPCQKILTCRKLKRLQFSLFQPLQQHFVTSVQDATDTENKPISRKARTKREILKENKKKHSIKINNFFRQNPHLATIKGHIPEKYFTLTRVTEPENLYLIDSQVAKKAAEYIIPNIKKNKNQIICETNAGLGLISSDLLKSGIKLVRLYESCSDFKIYLKNTFECYKGSIELFTKDIFLLNRYDYFDSQDHGNRVEQLLRGVPRKSWNDDPAMTIIGPLPKMNFIRYLIRSLIFQTFTTSFGRIQLYTFMKPRDFIILSAGPHLDLHTYRRYSVFFNLFFEYELLEKFPREVFLPWQSPKSMQTGRYPGQIDLNLMYFVRINFKKNLPVVADNFLPFYSFVMQFFGQGTSKVVPTIEKWVPGAGADVMIPKLKHPDYFKDLNIFTKFGELTPQQILAVFNEMITHPEYKKSHFEEIIESHLIKSETIETSLDEHLEKTVVDNVYNIESDVTL